MKWSRLVGGMKYLEGKMRRGKVRRGEEMDREVTGTWERSLGSKGNTTPVPPFRNREFRTTGSEKRD